MELNTKQVAHKLNAALRLMHQLDAGGRHGPDTPRDGDVALVRAADDAILLCQDLAAKVREEYPHTR